MQTLCYILYKWLFLQKCHQFCEIKCCVLYIFSTYWINCEGLYDHVNIKMQNAMTFRLFHDQSICGNPGLIWLMLL